MTSASTKPTPDASDPTPPPASASESPDPEHVRTLPSTAACVVYERRIAHRNWTPRPGVNRGKASRETWVDALNHHQARGDIRPIDVAIGVALSGYSNKQLADVWPSHATLGAGVGRSERTVRRSLSRLADVGLLDWCHRFLPVRGGRPRATSNLYVFTLSDEYRDIVEKRRRAKHVPRASGPTPPDPGPRRSTKVGKSLSHIPSEICAVVRIAPTLDVALAEAAGLNLQGGTDVAHAHVIEAWAAVRGLCDTAMTGNGAGPNSQREERIRKVNPTSII